MKKLALLLAVVLLWSAALPMTVLAQEAPSDEMPEIEEIINSAELNPQETASEELNALVLQRLEDALGEDAEELTTYDKVKACYDYLTENTSYGSHMRYLSTPVGDTTCGSIYRSLGEVEGFGAVALSAHVGMCNAYAAAFILMTRSLGLDSHLVEGSTASSGGGQAYHKWAEIDIDGVSYVFDPQLEQNLVASGLPAYTVFCRTYDEIPGRYVRQARND